MLSCWIDDPNMRPSFAQLHTTLGQLATKAVSYTHLTLPTKLEV